MIKTIITCDVCKKEEDCVSVTLGLGGSNYTNKTFDVCKKCCIDAKLFDEKFNPTYNYVPTTAEQLFNLLSEIARNAVEQQGGS